MAAEYNSPELIESFDELSQLPKRRWDNNTHYTPTVLKAVQVIKNKESLKKLQPRESISVHSDFVAEVHC